MASEFHFELNPDSSGKAILSLKGYLNEDADMPSPDIVKPYSALTVDLDPLIFMNSAGIKRWIFFFDKVSTQSDVAINFINCPKFISDQMSVVQGILPKGATVTSFLVPFYCKKCDRDFTEKKSLEEIKQGIQNLEYRGEVDCEEFPKCKGHYDVDLTGDAYSKFMD